MKAINCVGLTSLLLLPCAAQALEWGQDWSDWEVRPRLSTGLAQYKYQQNAELDLDRSGAPEFLSGAGRSNFEVEDSLLFAEIGASVFLGSFFVDFSIQKTDEGDDSFKRDVLIGVAEDGTNTLAFSDATGTVDLDRQEISLSIGYALTERFGIFVGFKMNETNFEQQLVGESNVSLEGPVSGTAVGDFTANVEAEFEQDGPFLGATYVWPFETEGWLNGALSIDLGVALLSGDLASKERQEQTITTTIGDNSNTESGSTVSGADYSGDALGLNLGVAWSGALTDRLNYSLGVDGYQYNFDGESGGVDFQDSVFRFSLGVSYAIDAGLAR